MNSIVKKYFFTFTIFVFFYFKYEVSALNVSCYPNIEENYGIVEGIEIDVFSGVKDIRFKCKRFSSYYIYLYIKTANRIVYDFKLIFDNIIISEDYLYLTLTNFKGFNVENAILPKINGMHGNIGLILTIYRSELEFYYVDNVIDSISCFKKNIYFSVFSSIESLTIDVSVKLREVLIVLYYLIIQIYHI